jgi:hypothetical protein
MHFPFRSVAVGPLPRKRVARIEATTGVRARGGCHALLAGRELAIAGIAPLMALQAIASRDGRREISERNQNQKCGESCYGTAHRKLLSEVLDQDDLTMHPMSICGYPGMT